MAIKKYVWDPGDIRDMLLEITNNLYHTKKQLVRIVNTREPFPNEYIEDIREYLKGLRSNVKEISKLISQAKKVQKKVYNKDII